MKTLIVSLAAYFAGGFPTAALTSRLMFNKDIRKLGSGNPGATNVWRVHGINYGLLVVLIDLGKGYFAAGILPKFLGNELTASFAAFLGLLAVCGHIWSPFLQFKGGKGVGAALGVSMALYPLASVILMGVWSLIVLVTRFASVASLTAAICYPIVVYLFYKPGFSEIIISVIIMFLLVSAHRSNLKRLKGGQELKIGKVK